MIEGWIGILGGVVFYLSWLVQSYETKKKKKVTFTPKFFIIRIIASFILLFEAIRLRSIGFSLVYIGTLVLMGYNLVMMKWHPKKLIFWR